MGLTQLRVDVGNPANRRRLVTLDMLVDSGAVYSVVPATVLRQLGIQPHRTERFDLADGTAIRRRLGTALFRFDGREGASTVIFGRPGDACLLGVVALEELGLVLDPIRRRLRPLRMVLGAAG